MIRKLGLLVLFCLVAHSHAYAGERNLLFVIGRDVENGEYDIYSADPDNLEYRKIIDNGINPLWSPDGQRIAVTAGGSILITTLEEEIASHEGSGEIYELAWLGDGRRIAFRDRDGISLLDTERGKQLSLLVRLIFPRHCQVRIRSSTEPEPVRWRIRRTSC